MANSGDWDSLDPGDTYYGYSWNFVRLYGRVAGHVQAGAGRRRQRSSSRTSPRRLGVPSDGGKTWTYKLRAGREVRGRHADHVQGRQVRASSARSTRRRSRNGPTYFDDFLDLPRATRARTRTPSAGQLGLKAIETPDDQTIVFHLKPAVRAASTTSPMLPATIPVPAGQGHRREVQEARRLDRPVHVRHLRAGQELHARAQPELGRGDRPEPQGAAGRASTSSSNVNADDIDNQLHRRRRSTSTSPAPACSRRR